MGDIDPSENSNIFISLIPNNRYHPLKSKCFKELKELRLIKKVDPDLKLLKNLDRVEFLDMNNKNGFNVHDISENIGIIGYNISYFSMRKCVIEMGFDKLISKNNEVKDLTIDRSDISKDFY